MSIYKIVIEKHIRYSGVTYSAWVETEKKVLWWTERKRRPIVRRSSGRFLELSYADLIGYVQEFKTEKEAIDQADAFLAYRSECSKREDFKNIDSAVYSWRLTVDGDGNIKRETEQ